MSSGLYRRLQQRAQLEAAASAPARDGKGPGKPAPGGRGDGAWRVAARLGSTLAPGRPEPGLDEELDRHRELKNTIQRRLLDEVDASLLLARDLPEDKLRELRERIYSYVAQEENVLPMEREQLAESLFAEILGYGPIQPLLDDEEVNEIMVNGPDQVWVERRGRLVLTPVRFHDARQVLHLIEKIVAPLGRRVDESNPMVDARLPDGSRVNVIIPPLALDGPVLTIRKFARQPLGVADLIRLGTLTESMAVFLEACVKARLNILVSGGTGSGKTTMLNVLSSFIPGDERIITIEDAAELQLRQEHVVRLETRPPNIEGRGEITIRQLVRNALRMRPDRIVVGEVRGAEALDMLQAMNTGHDGSLSTVHANSPRDVLSRLETMVLMAGFDLPVRAIREQIASAVDLIVHQARLKDGTRKVTHITEVQGMEGDVIVLQDVFRFQTEGIDDGGKVLGSFVATGIRPRCTAQLAAAGIELPSYVFTAPAAGR